MMCAFMTPVLKSDWNVYETNNGATQNGAKHNGGKRCKSSPKLTTVGSAPEMSRAQQLQRLRQIQDAQRRLLEGSGHNGRPRGVSKSCGVSRVSSRSQLPISPLALENKSNNAKGSNTSLNKFHNKVLDKLKDVFRVGENKDSQEGNEEIEPATLPNDYKERIRRKSSRLSSRNSFEIPKIVEETYNADGSLVVSES